MDYRKNLLVLSSPSGGGKTTLAKYLIDNYQNLEFSISCTTRTKREGEENNKEYYFLTKEEFEKKIEALEFVEFETLFDNYYGTLKNEISRIDEKGYFAVFDVDVNGALSLRKNYPNNTLLIFITPPSFQVLEERLRARGTETDEQIETRLVRAREELELMDQFDYIIVNDKLDEALAEIDVIANLFLEKKVDTPMYHSEFSEYFLFCVI